MIQKGSITIRCFCAYRATVFSRLQGANLFRTMFTHEMNDPICLRKSLMRAERTLEAGRLLGVSGGNMNGESLRMEKLLLTGGALKREMALVGL